MALFGESFTILWGTLAFKAYRVNALVMKQADSNAAMQNLPDGRLLAYVLGLCAVEAIPLLIYSTVDGGLVYTTNRCGRTECAASEKVSSVFLAMQAIFLGGIVAYGTVMAIQTRGASGGGAGDEDGGGAAAALVEAPNIGFAVYNMVFTSVLFYPSALPGQQKLSPLPRSLIR